jgi:hypothetical protein
LCDRWRVDRKLSRTGASKWLRRPALTWLTERFGGQ